MAIKELTNGVVFNMLPCIANFMQTHNTKVKMNVRQAIKMNVKALSEKWNVINEMASDIQMELLDEYKAAGKAKEVTVEESEESGVQIDKEYVEEFTRRLNENLEELAGQTVEVNLVTISYDDYMKWISMNEDTVEFTDEFLNYIEIFVDEETH